jgi:tetratricopeptide (TPR) repeat protein
MNEDHLTAERSSSATIPRPPHPVWGGLTLLALPPMVYCGLQLWYRWLRPDPQFLAFSAGIAQLIALVSLLGLQTEWGKRFADRLDQLIRQPRWWQDARHVCLTLWLAVAALGIILYLSVQAADLYNKHGAAALQAGQHSTAARDFRQAVSLSPGNAQAHYNLGNACEALHEFDQAIAEYQQALELDDRLLPAYNNLGRLYLRARHDPDAALLTLLAGLAQAGDPLSRAVLNKNIGQAYLDKGLPQAALSALEEATVGLQALTKGGASVSIYLAETYRLNALAYENLDRPEEARRAWAASRGHALAVRDSPACAAPTGQAASDCLNAQLWATEGREHLNVTPGGE